MKTLWFIYLRFIRAMVNIPIWAARETEDSQMLYELAWMMVDIYGRFHPPLGLYSEIGYFLGLGLDLVEEATNMELTNIKTIYNLDGVEADEIPFDILDDYFENRHP